MNKWYGKIGFVQTVQDPVKPTKWIQEAVEKDFCGDILKNNRRWEAGQSVNDDINISNQISVLADSYALANVHNMKYIEFYGAFWKINSIEIQMPRLILTIGGVWNGKRPNA